jgi:hypothetical protein
MFKGGYEWISVYIDRIEFIYTSRWWYRLRLTGIELSLALRK